LLVQASPAKFYSINSLFGISVREVNSVCDDSNGFIWASSKTSILRLTEDDYRIYHLPYETPNVVMVKLVNSHSKLCAYTNNGQIFTYNAIFDRFDLEINLNKALDDKFPGINGLLIDEAGDYWISTLAGLYKYHAGKFTLINEHSFANYTMTWYDRQHFILAGYGGLWMLDTQTSNSELIYANKSGYPLFVSALFYDQRKNALWIGTMSRGLYVFDFPLKNLTPVLESVFPKQPILAIEKNSDGTYLIGIDGQGLWKLNEKADKVLSVFKENADDPYSIRGNGVYDLFLDQNKRVWVGTISGGLSFFDQESPLVTQVAHLTNHVNSLINNDVNSLIEDHTGKLWFATNNGISCWDKSSDQWKHFYYNKEKQAQVFLTICEDNQGRIWAGTYSSGVYVIDSNTGKELAHYSRTEGSASVVNNFILNIFKDKQGDLWFAAAAPEFISYRMKEKQFKVYPGEPVTCFTQLSDDQLFLGCSNGLTLMDKKTGTFKKLLQDVLVRDMEIIGDNIWIGTSGSGLIRYNFKNGDTEKFTTESGLPSNFVNGVVRTDNLLWLGTENGLCRLNLNDKTVITYANIYSLSRNSFNNTAHYKLRNGQLAWGTNNGALIFSPDLISESPSKGKIIFQDLTISGRSVRELPAFELKTPVDSLKDIRLKYFQNTVSLELLPIGISSGSKFSWKMEGFDLQWSNPSANRIITYTNLPSGHFNLKVRLYDGSSSNVISERSLVLRVIPPFWRTGWFSVLVLVIVFGMIVLYFLYYTNRLKQRHTEEKVRFFTNTAHDIRTSLTLIKAPVDELSRETHLSESGRKYLQLAKDQARQLTSVVTQLMDFQKADIGKEQLVLAMTDIVSFVSNRVMMFESLANSRNIKLLFTTDQQHYLSAIDETKMEKVVDNLISNAVKYSHPDSKVYIHLKCSGDQWSLEVKDSGIGISKKAQRMLFKEFYRSDNAINSKVVGSGIGLLLVKKYVDLHQGNVSCESQENSGSTFKINLPAKKTAVVNNSTLLAPEAVLQKDPMPEFILNGQEETENLPSPEMKILVVEDNDELLNFMKGTLGREFSVLTAIDGKDAWNSIPEMMPDLIISDVMMPNMDGYELCHLIKSTYETSHIPVILLTALSEKSEQLRGLGLGADDYLTKPFDMSLLIQKMKTIIRNRRMVGEKAMKLVKNSPTEPILENEHNDQFMRKMLEVVKANVANAEFTKDDFASAMNVSSSLLYKKIKSLTDQSPTDFIKTYRLNYARELLETRRHNVTEVSELCGFTSIGYFSTVFKKHYGKSPTEIFD
jgi:signal transduction histidine kinase/DNA-binding response OmpR family regulator/ligand-binding sensor domain-containing protein